MCFTVNWLGLTALTLVTGSDNAQFTLVVDGQPRAAIVLSAAAVRAQPTDPAPRRRAATADPLGDVRLAAEELQQYIRAMSGAELPIVQSGQLPTGLLPLRLGTVNELTEAGLATTVKLAADADPSSFAILADTQQLVIAGASPEGALFGACELLEQLGVRWFLPGALGEVVPRARSLVVPAQQTRQSPSFPARRLQAINAPVWERRMRLAGPYFPASHGVPGFGGRQGEALFEQHPEYFSLIDGQRKRRQLCVSNPDVVRLATAATRDYFPNSSRTGDDGHRCQRRSRVLRVRRLSRAGWW